MLGLILVDELGSAYGDVYSSSVSASSIWPRWSVRRWCTALAVLCALLALLLPMRSLRPFLLMLSSVFVPLYGVILGRLGLGRGGASRARIDTTASLLWVAGIVLYHTLAWWAPAYGSTLPTLAFTLAGAWLMRRGPLRTITSCG